MADHRFHRYDLVVRQMMTVDPLQPVLTRLEEVLRSGHRVFIAGSLPSSDPTHPLPVLPPAYRDSAGGWHGGDFYSLWHHQAAQLLSAHATRGGEIKIPIPGKARVQEFENLSLWGVQGWR